MKAEKYKNPPGHHQSIIDGCTCPADKNAQGNGCGYVDLFGNPLFVVDLECKLHGENKSEAMDPEEICFDANEYAETIK